ncbi:hypothetical protein M0804_008912 [Polistes exclamans]|nr:hypothetical protein M0804_008912 [Polistes exclamans]
MSVFKNTQILPDLINITKVNSFRFSSFRFTSSGSFSCFLFLYPLPPPVLAVEVEDGDDDNDDEDEDEDEDEEERKEKVDVCEEVTPMDFFRNFRTMLSETTCSNFLLIVELSQSRAHWLSLGLEYSPLNFVFPPSFNHGPGGWFRIAATATATVTVTAAAAAAPAPVERASVNEYGRMRIGMSWMKEG